MTFLVDDRHASPITRWMQELDPAPPLPLVAALLTLRQLEDETVISHYRLLAEGGRPPAKEQARERQMHHLYDTLRTEVSGLIRAAATDGLTGLLNHDASMALLDGEFARARRYGTELSVTMLDLDRFGQLNLDIGHLQTNGVLATVCGVLRDGARAADALGRWGGDELLIVSPETGSEATLDQVTRLSHVVAAHQFPHGRVTLSGGVASLRPSDAGPRALLERANRALRRAKSEGRDRLLTWSPAMGEADIDDL